HGFVRGPDQLIYIGRRAFPGRYVTTDRGEWRLDHRVGDRPDRARILTAAEAPAEGAKLGFNLLRELSGLPAKRGRPPAVHEVLAPVEKKQSGFLWRLAYPFRHVERGLQPGVPRNSAREPSEDRVLESSRSAEPHRGKQDIPGGKPVVDRACRRP